MTTSLRLLPPERPKISEDQLAVQLSALSIDNNRYPMMVVGIRGYYSKSMGATPSNERGIYDDAICLYAPKNGRFVGIFKAFNGNTDPSKIRIGTGTGTGAGKGMAQLKPGVWYSYRFDIHNSKVSPHPAICQRAGPVTVMRDGDPPYEDSGMFGINIHRGGNYQTSSEGCQTVPPSQWEEFISTAHDTAKSLFGDQWQTKVLPYALLDLSKT